MPDLFDSALAAADLAQIDETMRLRAEISRLVAALHASELARLSAEIGNAHLERQNQGLCQVLLFQRAWYDAVYQQFCPSILNRSGVCFGPPLP